ncbi:hypothetical protein ACNOYE_08835 [Nannocystaceae bacterium ST9]
MAAKPARVVSSLLLGLVLALAGCKDDLEDLPDVDPVDDPWVDAITNEEEPIAGAPAPTPALAVNAQPTPGPELADPMPAVEGDPAAGTPTPATTEAAKLAGASVPSSTPKSGALTPTPSADPSAPIEPAAIEPAAIEPAAIEPAAIEPAPEAAPAKPAAPAAITMADYTGTYRFTGGSGQEQAVADAIEFGAEQVVLIARGIARKRLTKTQIIEDPITLTVTGDDLKIEWGTSGDSMTCVIDGSSTTMSYKGDKYKGRARSKDGKLVTSFQAPDATKTVVYTLSSDRKTLTVHHKLVADQLQEPVTFKLTYTRK